MSASKYIKKQGLPSLVYVARKCNRTEWSLHNWYKLSDPMFEVVVAGVGEKRKRRMLTYKVQCRCGWSGSGGELMRGGVDNRHCPECGNDFKPYPMTTNLYEGEKIE